jgi:predicted XRE-type DNA-binding protein
MNSKTKTENVFAEIGCTTPEALMLKAKLMVAVLNQVRDNALPKNRAESNLGLSVNLLNQLLKEDLNAFSLDEMVELAALLNIRMEIAVSV